MKELKNAVTAISRAWAPSTDRGRPSTRPVRAVMPPVAPSPAPTADSPGELLLVRHQQDAPHLAPQVLQLLDHHLPALVVQTPEALVDDHRLDRPVLPAGVLADAQGQAHRHAELLAARQERHVDRP